MGTESDPEGPPPPWVEFPESEPTWSGWRQGDSEAWLQEIWLPYWRALSQTSRASFLSSNPPPSDEWRFYLEAWATSR